jgi:hypothetical protein
VRLKGDIMKKQVKKLVLVKEMLKSLEPGELQEILGGLLEKPPTWLSSC